MTVKVECYKKIARQWEIKVVSKPAGRTMRGYKQPAWSDVKKRIIYLAPEGQDDIHFFHELSHVLYPHVSGEMFHDMTGFDLEQEYGGMC